jgi:hypothetical protein
VANDLERALDLRVMNMVVGMQELLSMVFYIAAARLEHL